MERVGLAHPKSIGQAHFEGQVLFDLLERHRSQTLKGTVQHPCEMLDIICVADTGSYNLAKWVHIGPSVSMENRRRLKEEFGGSEGVLTGYFCSWHDEQKLFLAPFSVRSCASSWRSWHMPTRSAEACRFRRTDDLTADMRICLPEQRVVR